MPTDGDRPEDQDSFDPLEQPPLVRRRPGARQAGDGREEDPAEHGTDGPEADAAASAATEPDAVATRPPKARGRFMGFLGLLAGLAGLGAAGYLYYLLVYLNPQADSDSRIAALEQEVASRTQALEDLRRSQTSALQDLADREKRARDALTENILESVNELAAQAPPSTREWKIAEVGYLLRIANHRLLMERDVKGALVLLKAADAIVEELDDFALYPVRAQLADEIQSLENVDTGDIQGLFLRLEAVKTEIGHQNVKLPRFERPETAAVEEPGFWAALIDQLGSYLRFRRFEGEGVRPLLAPEESVYLELNLRLMLEQAQLAALKRETAVFQQSLQTAANWIATYLDTDDPSVARALDELDTLSRVELDQPLPDISGSLNALKAVGDA